MLDYNLGDSLPVLDHGYVVLRDVMGSDESIANAARISYDSESRDPKENERLIRYLVRHKHTSPLEMGELIFELKMPIFVARQWVRHRTVNMNEVSARYTQLPAEMFTPEVEDLERQSKNNKQGRGGSYSETMARAMRKSMKLSNRDSYDIYEGLIEDMDLAREMARTVLPLSTYTKFVWKIDLHNLLHFLKLRTDPHAQKEIRVYAEIMEKLVALKFPKVYKAWVDYSKEAYVLSRMELEMVQCMLEIYGLADRGKLDKKAANLAMQAVENNFASQTSKREQEDFRKKILAKVPVGD